MARKSSLGAQNQNVKDIQFTVLKYPYSNTKKREKSVFYQDSKNFKVKISEIMVIMRQSIR